MNAYKLNTQTLLKAIILCLFFMMPATGAEINVTTVEEFVAAAADANEGDIILLAEGTYKITAPIVVKSGVTYKGDGSDKTIIDGGNVTRAFVAWGDRNATAGMFDDNEEAIQNNTGPKDWVIDGMTIQYCTGGELGKFNRFSYAGAAANLLGLGQDDDSFAENDTDGSGGLNIEEANADAGAVRLNGPDGIEGTEDDDIHRFVELDLNNDGELTEDELNTALAEKKEEYADQETNGGAIVLINQAVGTIQNCTFYRNYTSPRQTNNLAEGDNYRNGGAIGLQGQSVLMLNDCVFDRNYACNGPDDYDTAMNLEFNQCHGGHIFIGGNSESVLVRGTTLIANRCDFLNGRAEHQGGAIRTNGVGSAMYFDACWFEGNACHQNGTVIWVENNQSHELLMTNCIIAYNQSVNHNRSDRLINVKRNSKFINCTFVNNYQQDSQLIYNNANTIDIDGDGLPGAGDELFDFTQVVNCLFVNNEKGHNGGGNDQILGSRNEYFGIKSTNCLFFGNVLPNGDPAINNQREEIGSIEADPLLDPMTLAPGADSPAIDAGVDPNELVGIEVLTDFSGFPRPQGDGYDIGADEYQPPTE